MTNAVVVYHSLYGNTRKVADAIADGLRDAGAQGETGDTVRMIALSELGAEDLSGVDLAVAGVPTHKMNLPKAVQDALNELPDGAFAGVSFAAFDTSYDLSRWLRPFTAAHRLNTRLRKLGGESIAPPQTFRIDRDHEGPLLPGEVERARQWGQALWEQLSAPMK